MIVISRTACTLGLAFGLVTPAMADLTPQQVWDSWKSMGTGMGQTISVENEALADGTLTLTNVTITLALQSGAVTSTIPSLVFEDQDGSVRITMSPQYDVRVLMDPDEGETVDMTLQIATPGLMSTASGAPEDITYQFNGPDMKMTMAGMIVDGEPVEMDLTVAMTNLDGQYNLAAGDAFDFNSLFTAATLAIAIEGTDIDDPNVGLSLAANYDNLSTESSGSGPGSMQMGDPATMFADGSEFISRFTHEGGTLNLEVRDPEGGDFTMATKTDSGSLSASVLEGGIDYSGTSTGLDLSISGAQIPFPELTASMEQFGFGLKMPLVESEMPKDFGMVLNLGGLTVSDLLWNMIDSGNVIPRDPATLLVNLTGQAKLLVDLTDPEATAMPQAPGELHALSLNELRLSLAGAELTGSGAFTFDNSDLTTFNGMPAPDGSVDLQLVGGNGLLDKLVQLGLLPQDQAMGAQMMLGLFATPAGDDTLTSKIEVTPDGAISANGQRLQ